MTPAGLTGGGLLGLLAVLLVLVAALVRGLRRRPDPAFLPRDGHQGDSRPSRTALRFLSARPAALLVVVGIVVGTGLIGAPASAQPFDCKSAPEPDRPGTGLVGSLDPPRIDGGEPGSVYREVGYAGMTWHNYDLGCGGGVLNPATTTDTWLGNQTFNVAKFAVGGVNWAHYLIADGGALLDPLDGVITSATRAMYESVFLPWIGVALVILAIVLLVLAMRGDLARQTQRAALGIGALILAAAAYLAPVNWARAADTLLLDGVTQMQEGFLAQVGLGDRDTLPTVLVDQVVYQNWQRGNFGSPDVPQAQDLGRPLLRASTFTIDEVATGADTPELAEQKKADFEALAGQMGDRYSYFQGESGSRVGVGVLAVIQAVCIALFQLLSKVLVLVSMLLLRLMVMTAPVIAVVAVLKPDVLPALLRVAGAAIVNTVIVGALAGLHALLVVSLFRPGSGIDLWLALLVTGVVTVVLWAVARPFRRLVSMVSLTRDQFGGIVPGAGGGPMSRVWQRMRGPEPESRQGRWWDERRVGSAGGDPDAVRPEAEYHAPPVQGTVTQAGPGARTPRRHPQPVAPAQRGALPAVGGGAQAIAARPPARTDPGEIDERVIYRRRAPEVRAAEPEVVDGTTVYRIYRPARSGRAD
ncbi:hypothetical protein [Pseudonocardia oroxyli]|uniref:TrbL/VirB6 plasmid conjugal transfer protein n=1 Tax=Pseudonocardia oroxyli TaxID=366584 RepID=A0A1G7LAU6_PSEOR|nr:hypothetical protein [Pseudonocardia oroxyli]SDF46575.1 hypothetical protein SAMN05216377_10533 [Pseudonocardia oroxyli]